MRIVTNYVFPSIPVRNFDWSALDADNYEPGMPIGFGPTEAEAVADLHQQMQERKEYNRGNA